MESHNLYQITKKDFPKLCEVLTRCFEEDPLYCVLIPQKELRMKLLPKLFEYDLEEMFATCEIFSDSAEINSILVVSDESEAYNHIHYHITEILTELEVDGCLIKEDPSFHTFYHFMEGREYLNSKWTDQLDQHNRIHVIYLAVDPSMQHHDIAAHLLREVITYAQEHNLMISLETHNEKNVEFYEHFGFRLFEIEDTCLTLKQYCLIKENVFK